MDILHARIADEAFAGIDDRLFARRPKRLRAAPAAGRASRLDAAFLQPPRALPVRLLSKAQQRWTIARDKDLYFQIDPPDTGTRTLFYRGGRHLQIVGYEEVAAPRDTGGDPLGPAALLDADTVAASLERGAAAGAAQEEASGAGAGAAGPADAAEAAAAAEERWLQQTILGRGKAGGAGAGAAGLHRVVQAAPDGLLEVAPNLPRGIRFAARTKRRPKQESQAAADAVQDDLRREEDVSAVEDDDNSSDRKGDDDNAANDDDDDDHADSTGNADLDELLPVEFASLQATGLRSGAAAAKPTRRVWAHMVDLEAAAAASGGPDAGRGRIAGEMARTWPFALDAFQQEAIYHLECGESVFVAAHTSAGKTVVAEYAIALAQKHQTKAIYTSPIKALSNQKFRDFKAAFADVGLLTGDVQINPEAKCLIMTTEILRSKLYGQADLLREVEFVVFDEVHYVSDAERGVVWEEVIILLPEHVTLILLSATVPNTFEFASWVGRTKQRDVYVISTPKRPVPLEHYLWCGKGVEKIVGADRTWLEKGYRAAKQLVAKPAGPTPAAAAAAAAAGRGRGAVAVRGGPGRGGAGRGANRGGGRGGGRGSSGPPRASHAPGHMGRGGRATGGASLAQEKTLWAELVRFLRKASLLPACVFVFSRARCEEYAAALGGLDFCDAGEKTRIHALYARSVARLAREDQDLPQIRRLRALATRGVAVHHGGLLPIVKEVVELLFAQGLVKVLFATETFAVGLNLPTRTVVFSDYRKFDGTRRRLLAPGEYTQMAGRAGRRGLDSVGTAIVVPPAGEAHDVPPADTLKALILGTPARLTSQFRLTYNMILSLHRVPTLRVQDMLRRSFAENAAAGGRADEAARVQALEAELAAAVQARPRCAACADAMGACHRAAQRYRQDTAQLYGRLAAQPASGVFARGRLLVFLEPSGVRAVGVLAEAPSAAGGAVRVLALAPPWPAPDASDTLAFVPALRPFLRAAAPRDPAAFRVRAVQVPLDRVQHVAQHTVALDGADDGAAVAAQLAGLALDWASAVWDEVRLAHVRDVDVVWAVDDRAAAAAAVASSPALGCGSFVAHYADRHDEWVLRARLATLRRGLDDAHLALLPEYENRLAVLQQLGFVSDRGVVLLKGRVACEIRTADTLVLTEVVLDNVLAGLEPAEIAALLSVFVYQGKDDETLAAAPALTPGLTRAAAAVYGLWKDVVGVQEQLQVVAMAGGDDAAAAAAPLHFGLMEVVFEWASGSPFKTIAGMTAEQEGTIVRTITRLEETCREVRNIGRLVGDRTLEGKMNGVKEAIMRNVTTVPSLYL